VSGVSAQTATSPAGHWEGSIQVPAQSLSVQVVLQPGADSAWNGTITIPAQNIKAFPLSAVSVLGDAVTFAMKGIPGDPLFKGTVAKDGRSISGEFTQGGMTMPFTLAWKREATLEAPAASSPITADFEGAWEGALEAPGAKLRLKLRLSNQNGRATGTLVSVDQGGVELPIAPITQTGQHVKLTVGAVSGTYEGDLKDGQITGTWTQGGMTLPLVFMRPAK
jgi:hypothetical protein